MAGVNATERECLLEAMRAIAGRIASACDKAWSAESIASLVNTLIQVHCRLCLIDMGKQSNARDAGQGGSDG